jgi:hypothetical protein
MAKTIPEIQQLVAGHIQDAAAKLSSDEVKAAIEEALAGRYSKDRPRRVVADLTGDGAQYEWDVSTIGGWQAGFSQVAQIEYPQGERVPVLLEQGDWTLYESPAAQFLRFPCALASGKKARVQFTAAHAVDASSMPEADFYAVGALAAALAARRLAAVYTQIGDSSMGADTVNYRTKAQEYLTLARRLEKDYENLLGTDPERSAPAASRTAEWTGDTAGGERITH